MDYNEIDLIDNKESKSFELWIERKRSFIDYRLKNDSIYLIHTEVPPELEGKGIASALVGKALTLIEESGLRMVPSCSYVQVYLKRHPEWYRLVDDNEI